jgi:type III pantothenate kinase
MNICIDFGNTSIKAAAFNGDKIVSNYNKLNYVELLNLVNEHIDYKLAISSVSNEVVHIVNLIENKERLTIINYLTPVPIKNLYQTPETLGMDRLAAVIGAHFLYPETNCLVIDAGTCITYDLLDKSGNYHGGSISPGMDMRYKAINHYTAKLPMIEDRSFEGLIGKNTNDAIVSGINHGVLGEVNWVISSYKEKYPGIQTVMCGGNIAFFETKIKERIFAVPELVLVGLNRILNYNA